MTPPLFEIEDLHVGSRAGATEGDGDQPVAILHGISLTIEAGAVHALVGPNGSRTPTLAASLLGSPEYEVTSGRIRLDGDDITTWTPDVRAKAGLFLAFRYPEEIAGVAVLDFLLQALSSRDGREVGVRELRRSLTRWMDELDIDPAFVERHLNEGFSAQEKIRHEILQMAVLQPRMAILDLTDAGLAPDAFAPVANGAGTVKADRPELGLLAITNHQRLLGHLQPNHVHVLFDGHIVASGGPQLARQLETDGYESFRP